MRTKILIDVPTTTVERVLVKRTFLSKVLFFGNRMFWHPLVKHGRWHQRTTAFTDHPTHVLLQALLSDSLSDEDRASALTAYYLARGKSAWQAEKKVGEKLEQYMIRYHNIAESMRRNGYLVDLASDEIGIAIAPDGSFIKVSGGNHRLAIARLIDLPTVVAEVRFVHRDWLRAQPRKRGQRVPERIVAGLTERKPRIVPIGHAGPSVSRGRG